MKKYIGLTINFALILIVIFSVQEITATIPASCPGADVWCEESDGDCYLRGDFCLDPSLLDVNEDYVFWYRRRPSSEYDSLELNATITSCGGELSGCKHYTVTAPAHCGDIYDWEVRIESDLPVIIASSTGVVCPE